MQFAELAYFVQEQSSMMEKREYWAEELCVLVASVIQYKTTMGKRLRNCQIQQASVTSRPKEKTVQAMGTIDNNKLKKIVHKKFDSKFPTQKHLKFTQRLRTGQLASIIDQSKLECPICLQLMVQPTMMICGHLYCFRCLESNTAHSQRCCLCRQEQQEEPHQPSHLAENLIDNFLLPRSKQVLKYLCRTSDCSEWKKRRYVNNVRPGLIVDFHDNFNMWRRAVVIKTFISKDKMMVMLKMNFKGTQIINEVQITSKRLAPSKFFTKGKYLEEYSPSLPEYDYRQKELYSLEYRRDRIDQQIFMNHENQDGQAWNTEDYEEEQYGQPVSQNILDQALVLFNLDMTGNDLIL